VLVAFCALALVSCDVDAALNREVNRAIERTVPGEQKPYSSGLERDRWSASASWEFDSSWAWPQYTEWVTGRLSPAFERIESTDDVLVFVRVLDGDTHTIRLERIQQGPPIRIRGTFRASAS
jgi:hypothetical protein